MMAERFVGPLTLQHVLPRYPQDLTLCELDMLARLTTAEGIPVTVMGTTGGMQPDRQEAVDWSQEDPRSSALQRQLTEVDRWLRGQPHKLATAQEALTVEELVEAMLAGHPKI